MDEGYPEKLASPNSVLANGSFMAASEGSNNTKGVPSFNGFDEREGTNEEAKDNEGTVPEKAGFKQGLPYEGYDRENEEIYDKKEDLNDDKNEATAEVSEQHENDYSYLADLESRAAVKFNTYVNG